MQVCCRPCMQVQVGISKQVCCQSGIQAIAGISIQMYRHFYLQASVAPGIGMPTLTGMTQASAPAQAVATGRSRRRAYTRPAGSTTTTLRHSSQACHCQVIIVMMIILVISVIFPISIMMMFTKINNFHVVRLMMR